DPEAFPRDVVELLHYFDDPEPGQAVIAVPGAGLNIPVWILGSSLFGAQLAAALGLPYSFASHFAPAQLFDAIALYRARFKPSERLEKPYVMLGFNVFGADTREEAEFLASSMQQAFVNLRRGRPSPVPPPVDNYRDSLLPHERDLLDEVLSCSAIGTVDDVREGMRRFIDR